MTSPPLPKPVFIKRKPSSKRRRRTEIPSPPHSPRHTEPPPTAQPPHPRSPRSPPPRPPRRRVIRANHHSFTPDLHQPRVDYSAESLQRLLDAQKTRPAAAVHTPGIREPPVRVRATAAPQEAARPVAAPFTAAWDPVAGPEDLAVEEEPDLAFLATHEASSSSDGWESAQLARGGGRGCRDFRAVVRGAEEAPGEGFVARLRSGVILARAEWAGRALAAGEAAERARGAAEKARGLMRDAGREVVEAEDVVEAYEQVLGVFRRVCAWLGREKDAVVGFRGMVVRRLEREAEEVRVRLLGGVDEFGRSLPGGLGAVEDGGEVGEDEGMDGVDVEGMMDDVIAALERWRSVDRRGYTAGFAALGGGRVIGRLALALPSTSWLGKLRDEGMREAAAETGDAGVLMGAEIRARWEPRRREGFKEWCGLGVQAVDAVKERFGWEVDACVRQGDRGLAERCLEGGFQAARCGVDPGLRDSVDKLRAVLGNGGCEAVEREIQRIEASQGGRG